MSVQYKKEHCFILRKLYLCFVGTNFHCQVWVAGGLEASSVLPAILEVRSLYNQYRSTKTLNAIKPRCFVLSHSFTFFWFHFLSLYLYMVVCFVCFCLCKLCTFIVMFMYAYCYVCSVLGILFHCVVLCIVCVCMCTVLLPPGVNPIAVNKIYHIISYHIISHNIIHFISRYKLIGPYFHSKYLNSCF